MLLACALVPETSKGKWAMPKALYWGAWLILSLGYTVSGVHKLGSPSWVDGTAILRLLDNPLARDVPWREWLLHGPAFIPEAMAFFSLGLELLFLPLALFRWTRPWVWLAMAGMHLGILALVSFADLTLGILMIHLFTFDSGWLRPSGDKPGELVLFFDGVCGLCNSVVDFALAEDLENRLRFSPLQGALAARRLTPGQTHGLESLVLIRDGAVLEKSAAVLELCRQLGGVWRLAGGLRVIPAPVRDFAYDVIARNRYRWFGRKAACRLPSAAERARFIP
jgi:predicted DCC family thiol-disulfide oxidoreductase YuxK